MLKQQQLFCFCIEELGTYESRVIMQNPSPNFNGKVNPPTLSFGTICPKPNVASQVIAREKPTNRGVNLSCQCI